MSAKVDYTVQAVVTAFRVLDALKLRPMGCTELGAVLGVPKNATFRHAETLADLGQVDRLEGGLYALSAKHPDRDTSLRQAASRAFCELSRVLHGV
jgi:DNA-binding IclR family transcriptional regulator